MVAIRLVSGESDTGSSASLRIDAELLIPGRGEPIRNATLVASKSKILHVGSASELPEQYTHLKATKVPVLLPGLWDCHVHFFGAETIDVDVITSEFSPAQAGARTARDVAALLNAGFTSVRELGGYGIEVKPAIEDGWLAGPSIYSAVALISTTAGHADARSLPMCMVHDRMSHGLGLYVCDGVDEAIKAVRAQVRRGASVIKVATSGGVASADDVFAPQFSDKELEAVVAEAERNDLIVAAHCHGIRGVRAALEAGCKTLEHGSYLDDEAIDMMVKNDVYLIATRSIQEFSLQHQEIWSDEAYRKLLAIADANKRSYQAAIKAGVKIALGTDLGISSLKTEFYHGTNGTEFQYAAEAGLTPLQAIEAGTASAPETLGKKAPKTGQLRPDFDADFIAMDVNPLEDISALGKPVHVTHVWKGGKLCKGR